MSINEKLAELCGMTLVGHLWCSSRNPINLEPEYLLDGIGGNESSYLDYWNPIQDLNQLEACWKMLTLEQKATYKQLIVDHDVQSVFESPEQHAELILKAKGVS